MRIFVSWLCACVLALLFSVAHAQDAATAPTAQAEAASTGPKRIVIGAYINDIQALDLRTHSYVVDLYVWFRWTETDPEFNPISSFEFMNRYDPESAIANVTYLKQDGEPEALQQPDGSFYNLERYQGSFSTKFPVRRFPFDDQELVISIEDNDMGADELVFVADPGTPLTVNSEIRLPGYKIGDARMVVSEKSYDTSFGDLSEPDVPAYSRVSILIPIKRPWLSGAVKTLLPVVLIILCASAALLLSAQHVEARIGLAITALLTLVALQFSMAGSLPDVSYLLMLDQIYIASYGFILVVVALIVMSTRKFERHALATDVRSAQAKVGPSTAAAVTILALYAVAVGVILSYNLLIPERG